MEKHYFQEYDQSLQTIPGQKKRQAILRCFHRDDKERPEDLRDQTQITLCVSEL